MQFDKNQMISVAAFVLAAVAVVLVVTRLESQTGKIEKLESDVKLLQQVQAPVIETPTKVANRNISSVGDTIWEFHPPSDLAPYRSDAWSWTDGFEDYVIRLGEQDKDGEIRHLEIRNTEGIVKKMAQLPINLTYIKSIAEGDGTPMNRSPGLLSAEGNSSFRIEAYLATPLDIFDYRLPVVVKYIYWIE